MDKQSPPQLNKTQLSHLLHQFILESGQISFADFMSQALYHPEYGYYMCKRNRIGKSGDFFTSSSVNKLFGKLVARQLADMNCKLSDECFQIVEQGAGEGHLALDILDALSTDFPEFYDCLTYTLVEVSQDNRDRQRKNLINHISKISWADSDHWKINSGCFLSNELVDAFPVHLVEKHAGKIHEVFVHSDGKTFQEVLRVEANSRFSQYFDWLGVSPCEGNRVEVNFQALEWMNSISQNLEKGFVMTIDYGYPSEELYAPFRRTGTLMCYQKHQADDNPYDCIGEKDITSHVDFSALQKIGQESGLMPLWFGEQYRFLLALGFFEELIQMEAETQDENEARALRLTLKNLIMPEQGMGETFKVLIQGKGVENPELQCSRPLSKISAALNSPQ